MQRFVYVPKVEVFIRCDGDKSGRLVDVTEDIIDGSVVRNVDQLSTASLTLQNKFGRYTGGSKGTGGPNAVRFRSMDRIIIRMARVGDPFLTFSGYLDEVPYSQIYPGPVHITASCTLKLIQQTYFDPGVPFMISYFQQFGWKYDPQSGMLSDSVGTAGANQRFGYLDVAGGVGDVMKHVLHDVGNWPNEAIDIADLPTGFLKSIESAFNYRLTEVQKNDEAMFARLKKFLGSTGSTTGSGATDTTTNPTTGSISMEGVAVDALQAGFKGDSAITIVAIARAESALKASAMNYNGDGSYDVGLFQINTVHTPGGGGTGLPAPPGGTGTLAMPGDWNTVKASLPANVRTYITNCLDPAFNTKEAYSVSGSGTNFTPWVTYNNNLHKPFLAAAKNAVDAAAKSIAIGDPNAGKIGQTTTVPDPAVDGRTKTDGTTGKSVTIATNIVKISIAEQQKGIHESGGQNQGPEIKKYQDYVGLPQAAWAQWCAAFASWVYGQAGLPNIKSSNVAGLEALGHATNNPQPADMIHWGDHHVGIVVARTGNTISYVAGNESDGVNAGSSALGDGATYIHFDGVGQAAPDAATTGPGAGGDQGAAGTQDAIQAGLQAGWNVLQTQGSSDTSLSIGLTGERAIANDVQLLGWIAQVCAASGRSFMSKPNGEFFAFFPDYFNYYTDTPYFHVSDIELVEFTVYESDTNLTTHYFASGPIGLGGGHLGPMDLLDKQNSMIASVEDEAFRYFINSSESDPQKARGYENFDAYEFLRRYGARPMSKDYADIQHPVLLWLVAWRDFTMMWASRYTADVQTTFLPELFPGTVVSFGGLDGITMYVKSVTHNFSRTGGFSTSAELMSPATSNNSRWKGLPISGQFEPSIYTTGTDFFDSLPNG